MIDPLANLAKYHEALGEMHQAHGHDAHAATHFRVSELADALMLALLNAADLGAPDVRVVRRIAITRTASAP